MEGNITMMAIIYILLIILISVLIVLGIKAILVVDNLNETLKDVNKKIHSLDGMFEFFDGVSNTFSFINKKVISKLDTALSLVKKMGKGDNDE